MESNELRTKYDYNMLWFTNDLTRFMDEYLFPEYERSDYSLTYIDSDHKTKDKYYIRYPGTTRGHIQVDDNNVIKDIELYETAVDTGMAIYRSEIKGAVKEFIGRKIVFEKGTADLVCVFCGENKISVGMQGPQFCAECKEKMKKLDAEEDGNRSAKVLIQTLANIKMEVNGIEFHFFRQ